MLQSVNYRSPNDGNLAQKNLKTALVLDAQAPKNNWVRS